MLFVHKARFLLLLDNFCFNGSKNAEPVLYIQSEIEEETYGEINCQRGTEMSDEEI